jgi:hypothetical protein
MCRGPWRSAVSTSPHTNTYRLVTIDQTLDLYPKVGGITFAPSHRRFPSVFGFK